jgi:hypothetical protein
VTAASETQRRILREFTNTLEQCPRVREESSWELLVANISSRLGANLNLRKQATARAYVIELVRVCARLPRGLKLIADELQFLDPLAPEVPALLRLLDEWEAATRASVMRQNRIHWGEVPPRNVNFTGREELLRQLHERLEPGVMTAVVPHALRGLGGVEKTQLAAEYAYRHRADFDMIWWIPGRGPGTDPGCARRARPADQSRHTQRCQRRGQRRDGCARGKCPKSPSGSTKLVIDLR